MNLFRVSFYPITFIKLMVQALGVGLGEGQFANLFILHPFRLPNGQCPLFEFRLPSI